jgi:hypothetical protein
MLLDDHARALHLLQQMGPATGSLAPIPYQPSFSSSREAAILTAQIPTEVLAAAASATVVRNQQVAEFTTAAGCEAHAAAILIGATEGEAAQATQAAAVAALAAATAAIAEADATTSTA